MHRRDAEQVAGWRHGTDPVAALRNAGTDALPIPSFTALRRNTQGYIEYRHDPTGIVFVALPGGTFRMGSPDTEKDRQRDEGPVFTVELSSFFIAKHELTQEVWEKVMGANPSLFDAPGKTAPVEQVSWTDCVEFCKRTGLRLPTEAQWEYAARAGTQTSIPSLDAIAWYDENSSLRSLRTGPTRSVHRRIN